MARYASSGCPGISLSRCCEAGQGRAHVVNCGQKARNTSQPTTNTGQIKPSGLQNCFRAQDLVASVHLPAVVRRTRQKIDEDVIRDWKYITGSTSPRVPLRPWTLALSLAAIIKFYLIPEQLRFIIYITWSTLQRLGCSANRRMVLQGRNCKPIQVHEQGAEECL